MSEFSISPATSLSFVIETGTGTINDGSFFDGNYAYTTAGLQAFFNTDCITAQPDTCQPFNKADSPSFQWVSEVTGAVPDTSIVDVYDTDGNFIGAIGATEVDTTNNVWEATADFSSYAEGCYEVRIYSIQWDAAIIMCADGGTFEANDTNFATATGNAAARSMVVAQGGSWSECITASAIPDETHAEIGFCNNLSFGTNSYYRFTAYVLQRSTGTQFVANGETVGFGLSGFTDATIYSTTIYDPATDADDNWHQISIEFMTGSDSTGSVTIQQLANIPNASGVIYVDTLAGQRSTAGPTKEATSQCLSIKTNHINTLEIEYYGDTDSFGIDYESSGNFRNKIRMCATFYMFQIVDENFIVDHNSEGVTRAVRSYLKKVRTLEMFAMPGYLYEKAAIALKHDHAVIDGVEYICDSENIAAEWTQENGIDLARSFAEMRLRTYDLQNTLC